MSDSWPRRRLLAILRGASEPLDAQELARITGQHVTTVRFHLDVLTRESLVRQFQQPPRGRGRPRIGYSAVQRSVGYQELAQVLADQLGPDPRRRSEAAIAAGRAWGAKLDAGEHRVESLDDAKEVTMTVLSELGFAPERDPNETSDQALVRLTACPLRELARTHSEVVCGVHLGLIKEVLDRSGARGEVNVRLHPFVEPELCVVRLEMLARRAELRHDDLRHDDLTREALRHDDLREDPRHDELRRDELRGEPDNREVVTVPVVGDTMVSEPLIAPPSGSRVAPQLRNGDPNIAKQSAQQW